MTMNECGLMDALQKRTDITLLDRSKAGSPEEVKEIYHKALSCDYYFMSTNAITLDGQLVNTDGTGNRVAALSGAAGTADANPAAGAAGTANVNPAAGAAGTANVNPAAGAAGTANVNPAAGAAGTANVNPAASAAGIAPAHPKKKPKVKGGHLRELLNYSDRF